MISSRLARETVGRISHLGGTMLGSARCDDSKQMRESFFGLFLRPVFYVVIVWIAEKIRSRRQSATHRTTEFPTDASVVKA